MKAHGENLGPQKNPTFFLMKGQTPAHWEPGHGKHRQKKTGSIWWLYYPNSSELARNQRIRRIQGILSRRILTFKQTLSAWCIYFKTLSNVVRDLALNEAVKRPASYVHLSKCDKCSSSRTLPVPLQWFKVFHSVCHETHREGKKEKGRAEVLSWNCLHTLIVQMRIWMSEKRWSSMTTGQNQPLVRGL